MKPSGTTRLGCFAAAIALGLLSALVPAIPIATAGQYLLPSRFLRPDERLSQSVGLSDAICEARLVSIVNSSRQLDGGAWTSNVELVLHPITWLVGHDSRDSIRVGIGDTDSGGYQEFRSKHASGAVMVVFLVRVSHDPRAAKMAAMIRPPDQDWVLLQDPYAIREGVLPVAPGGDSTIPQVRREIARHSLSALASASDVIVLGHPVGVMAGRDSYILSVQIDSLIAGTLGARNITIKAPTPSDLPDHPSLMFLKHAQGDTCTVVAPAANQTVRDGVLTKSGLPIGDALAEIRKARRMPARKPQ